MQRGGSRAGGGSFTAATAPQRRPLFEHLPLRTKIHGGVPGLQRQAAGFGKRRERDSGVHAGAVPGYRAAAAEAELHRLLVHGAGTRAERADCPRAGPGRDCWRACWCPITPIIARSGAMPDQLRPPLIPRFDQTDAITGWTGAAND